MLAIRQSFRFLRNHSNSQRTLAASPQQRRDRSVAPAVARPWPPPRDRRTNAPGRAGPSPARPPPADRRGGSADRPLGGPPARRPLSIHLQLRTRSRARARSFALLPPRQSAESLARRRHAPGAAEVSRSSPVSLLPASARLESAAREPVRAKAAARRIRRPGNDLAQGGGSPGRCSRNVGTAAT